MKHIANKLGFIIVSVVLGIVLQARAQQAGGGATGGDRPPARGDANERAEGLTAEQVQRVQNILAGYNAATLTAEQARAIHEAFRQAGVRGGPALNEAVTAAGFDPARLRDLAPPPDRANGREQRQPLPRRDEGRPSIREEAGGRGADSQRRPEAGAARGNSPYSIEQAISERAQLNTLAFDGLAFLTGDLGCNTFLPPGKVADFCGFQYMRDVDSNQLGHNTSFVPLAANNVLSVLTDEQKAQFIALAKEQEPLLTEFAYKRFPLIQAFCRQLEGNLPAGSSGLNREAVMKVTAGLYEIDGRLSYRRAEVLGGIVRSLTDKAKTYLAGMRFNDSSTWPVLGDQIDKKSLSRTAHVAVMTYASELFSWYAGNVEADVYFCPERHATYFGSFYMKDIPAMGNANFSISTSLTGDSGEAFLAALTESQRRLVTGLVVQQKADLAEIVTTRRAIATELRRFMTEPAVPQDKVLALSRRYGELDGEISYYCATAFSGVARTLTAEQKKTLLKLRNLDARYSCKGAYLYSQAIEMPVIPDTDFLFAAPGAAQSVAPTGDSAAPAAAAPAATARFVLRSAAVEDGGQLPREYAGDGAGATLPLEWTGAPEGTQGYAVVMHHMDPEGKARCYWILYDIPAGTTSLPKNVKGVGTIGNNTVNGRAEYAPPHSKGPGPKTYVYTVYALSAPVRLGNNPAEVSRVLLLEGMKGIVLASAELRVIYSREM